MTYIPPQPASVVLEFTGSPYIPPAANAVVLDFADTGSPVVVYPPVPGVVARVGLPWARRGAGRDAAVASAFGRGTERDQAATLNASPAGQGLAPSLNSRWNKTPERYRHAALPWRDAQARSATTQLRHQQAPARDIDRMRVGWDGSITRRERRVTAPFLVLTPTKDSVVGLGFDSVDRYGALWRLEDHRQPPLYFPNANLTFDTPATAASLQQPVVLEFGYVYPNRPAQPKESSMRLPFGDALHRDIERLRLPWGPSGSRDTSIGIVYPDYPGPIDPEPPEPPPIRATYIFMNTVNVVRLPDRTPIDMTQLSLGLDADSWAWTLRGEVTPASLALIEPTAAGTVDIEVEINGWTWVFMIERYRQRRQFANQRYTVEGVSRTQLLASPYAPLRAKLMSSDIGAKQAAQEELLNTGFTLNWDTLPGATTPDWIIPGGVFAYQDKTPLQAIKWITDTAGAILLPSPNADELTVQPRYKVPPWQLSSATVDAIIPAAMVTDLSLDWQPRTLFNGVYVSGVSHGVGVDVARSGTPGDVPAPDVYEDLLVATEVNTERGRQVIADSGNQALVGFTLPIPESLGAPGVVMPGMIIEFVEGGASWRGYAISTNITAPRSGNVAVTQQLTIVRHYEHG